MTAVSRLRPSQLAHRLGIAPDVIYAWIKRGLLPAECVERDGKWIFILGDKFDEFARSGGLERSYILRHSIRRTGKPKGRPVLSVWEFRGIWG
jgi:hypothetical protein